MIYHNIFLFKYLLDCNICEIEHVFNVVSREEKVGTAMKQYNYCQIKTVNLEFIGQEPGSVV